ncbi:MAG: acetyl/propionyl/methylcrotonyl-CoA carboxylase subunit alpha [Pseudomonadota bacterium]
MFDTILIANRGEIACRVITTAKRLGIKTVAVYSDADRNAKHVSMANRAVHIGASQASESYLNFDNIIEAAKQTGAEAIHPGYGFLSENPKFVQAVGDAGLTFIGPSAAAIEAMGLKDSAKALMQKANVPVVPGYHGDNQDPDFLTKEAEAIGYPVLIKARAGGGGKGMRLVEKPADFKSELESAQREAQASFGDPICLIEKYITKPRHIELQVFGDNHGNVVHLFERDCSLQRRHQKVIEEAPAPEMPQNVRNAMGKAAVDAAKAIGYSGAGTVEFIVDGSNGLQEDGFWFMEMNTRLQVEHPVSEAITGLDFVELQLRVAAGEVLPVTQSDLTINGWSFEARIYAEDVPKGFLPAIGTIEHLRFPGATAFKRGSVRVDSGIREGDEISPFYDPMIAKLIVHGPNRATALKMLHSALGDCHIGGSVTNLAFLSALSAHFGFASGDVDTGLIGRDLDKLSKEKAPDQIVTATAGLMAAGLLKSAKENQNDPWNALSGWRHWSNGDCIAQLIMDDVSIEQRVQILGQGHFIINGELGPVELSVTHEDDTRFRIFSEGETRRLDVAKVGNQIFVFDAGQSFSFTVPDPLARSGGELDQTDDIVAPMPGLVTIVSVNEGDQVAEGDPMIVLEAMKMEHALFSPRDGVVAERLVDSGAQVLDGSLLLRLEPKDA